ncbi:hypothetical protein DPX39_000027800 [Trypanosoma brucei equiperdum]|uniref:Uncharacterized protein n=1 Tax=Trypanosoma brucei equiperdum TaxID=630700 RepID=A0A3L6KSX2_9TRYP|nr:hypothetical protein DPX39_000027800 [Trypanosoma brucei equiperdum]
MSFVPASQTASVDRDVFINHGGAYWINPVPGGTFAPRSTYTSSKKGDLIDPFGNPKVRDVPDLFGRSRYSRVPIGSSGDGAIRETSEAEGDGNGGVDAVEGVKAGTHGNDGGLQLGSGLAGTVGDHGQQGETIGTCINSAEGKQPFSTGDIMDKQLPLDTANPERRIAHPGNHTDRIPPTGGSEYNGTVTEPWCAPAAVDNTYLRLPLIYESTTHYQQRTGRYYTEDQAPPHGMSLPPKCSLPTREW